MVKDNDKMKNEPNKNEIEMQSNQLPPDIEKMLNNAGKSISKEIIPNFVAPDDTINEIPQDTGNNSSGTDNVIPSDDNFTGYFKVCDRYKDVAGKSPEFLCKVKKSNQIDDIPESLQNFYVLAEETNTVIETLYTELNYGEKAKEKRDKYVGKLIEISEVGLNDETPQPALATKSMNRLRNEILIKEGGKVKNMYFKKLGMQAAVIAGAAVILAILFTLLSDEKSAVKIFHNNIVYAYLYVIAGSAIGTWISFGARKKQLTFANLAVMEEDRINSGARLFFVAAVSVVFTLFLNSNIFKFSIGSFNISSLTNKTYVEYQLIVGVLSGLVGNNLVKGIYDKANDMIDFNSYNNGDVQNEET